MSKLFISSSCVKAATIADAVKRLAQLGYKNIELSGGTNYYDGLESDLLDLKSNFNLNYLCHNYFPPPKNAFVINLAALSEHTLKATIEHLKTAIDLSVKLGASKYGFHAGFQIDIPLNQVGVSIAQQKLWDYNLCVDTFCQNFDLLQDYNKANNLKLYIENNVIAPFNYKNFNKVNPFLQVDFADFQELRKRINFTPLLDVAHLKVSAATLGLDFKQQLTAFIGETDYIHISDNDGLADSNGPLIQNSELFDQLSVFSLKDKTITLEVYSGLDDLEKSFNAAQKLMQ